MQALFLLLCRHEFMFDPRLSDLKLDCTWEVKAKDSKLKATINYSVILIISALNCVACSHAGRSAWREMLDS